MHAAIVAHRRVGRSGAPRAGAVVQSGAVGDGVTALRRAIQGAGARVTALLRSAGDPARPLPRSEWTVGDAAAHLAEGVGSYVAYLSGSTEPWADLSDLPGGSVAASNARHLAEVTHRDLAALAGDVDTRLAEVVALTEGRHDDDPVFWHGLDVSLTTFLSTALAELLVHGLDVARALGRPWPIAAGDARLVADGLVPLLPLLVDRDAARGVRLTYEVRLRGGGRFTLAFRDGAVDARPGGSPAADCRISADPVAFLLVAYGRRSQWSAAATGRLVAWGRKPWVAFRLTSLLVPP